MLYFRLKHVATNEPKFNYCESYGAKTLKQSRQILLFSNCCVGLAVFLPDACVFPQLVVEMIVKIEILLQHQPDHNSYLYQNQTYREVAVSIYIVHLITYKPYRGRTHTSCDDMGIGFDLN